MGYYIDLKKISIEKYKSILGSMDLLPSWKILENNIEENLERIQKLDIHNLDELTQAIKTKNKLQDFSQKSGLSVEYLTILRRVINGYIPKPNKFRDFPNIDERIVKKLEAINVKNTLQLYDKVLTLKQRTNLSNTTKIPLEQLDRLARLTDLSRIKWVNHTFAYVLYESGFQSAEEVAKANYKEIYEKVKAVNLEQKIYKGTVGLNDMKRCVEAAKGLDFEIKYK